MKYIYGPVRSRRLGLSLGLSLTPYKVCSFDCVYCQVGTTTELTRERKEYIPIQEILDELKSWLENNKEQLDYITLSGQGEPTLNIKIGELISQIKKLSSASVAVITNGSLLIDPQVRTALKEADLIVPSLDAVVPKVFQAIDRPAQEINVEGLIQALVDLRREYSGKIWLEVMLVRGVNDDLRYIKKLKEAIERINPDLVQLNSPVRMTAEQGIFPVSTVKLRKIKQLLGEKCQVL